MATKEKKEGKKKGGAGQAQGGTGKTHTGVGTPAPAPRLKGYYERTVRGKLKQQFGLTNAHEIPKLTPIVINCGVGAALPQPEPPHSVVQPPRHTSGQRPAPTPAKKSIGNCGLHPGHD